MKHLKKIVKQISILILIISLFGCNDENTTYPEVEAGYTYTINPATGTVVFMNISENSRNYEWDFGDGETSTEINPIKTFAAGTYTVVLKAKNLAGGTDTFESVITIDVPITPCTAEVAESLAATSLNMTFKTEPVAGSIVSDGASFDWVLNPSYDNLINGSCKVGKVSKQGINPWDNIQIVLGSKLDLNANGGFKIKVYSAVPGFKVLLKLEDKANAGINTEIEVATTKTKEWEELTFDFPTTATNKFDKIVLIFDLATKNTNTYYFDDLKLFTRVGGGTGGTCTAETAETLSAAGLNMTFKTDLSTSIISDGAGFSWVDNPNSSNTVNPSCKVAKIVKSGQFPWDNNQINLNAKLDFTANAGLKIKVYSAKAGFKVRIKLEEIGNAGNNTELELPTTKTNEWEELTFPFASDKSNKFNKIVIFFDLNGSNKDTYYFDDLKVYERTTGGGTGGGGTGNCVKPAGDLASNGGFENGNVECWEKFLNQGSSFTVTTNQPKSGSYSGHLVSDFAAGGGGAVDTVIKQANVGVGTITPNKTVVISFDLRGTNTVGGVVFAEFFSELSGGGTSKATMLGGGPISLNQAWTTYTYTVTTGSDVSGGVTLQLKTSCGPVGGCKVDAYFDNVSIKPAP